jgi:hypothetical protein
MFIHDSEINPEWHCTDDMLYKSYEEFSGLLAHFLDDISKELVKRSQEEMSQEDTSNMIFLITMGHTKDKRVLFAFNPHEQNDMFFVDGSFDKFAFKIFEYIETNFDEDPNKPFVVFADTKTVVITEDRYVYDLIDSMMDVFKKKEKYEMCSKLSEIKDRWRKSHSTDNPDASTMTQQPVPLTDASAGIKKPVKKRKTKTKKDAPDKEQ